MYYRRIMVNFSKSSYYKKATAKKKVKKKRKLGKKLREPRRKNAELFITLTYQPYNNNTRQTENNSLEISGLHYIQDHS